MPASFQSGVAEHDFASQATTVSLIDQLQPEAPISSALYLSEYPPIYLLPQGLSQDDHRETSAKLKRMKANIATEAKQARFILSFASGAVRAKYDLTTEGFEDIERFELPNSNENEEEVRVLSFRSRRESNESAEGYVLSSPMRIPSESGSDVDSGPEPAENINVKANLGKGSLQGIDPTKVSVVELQWLHDSIAADALLPIQNYILLQASYSPRQGQKLPDGSKRRKQNLSGDYTSIVPIEPEQQSHSRTIETQIQPRKRLLLSQETTEELEIIDQRVMPEWVQKKMKYSCQRIQTQPTENEDFLTELKLIKHKRTLDDTHSEKVRNSYGKAIASIGAYPYPLLHPSELKKLPRCGEKFERLFREFQQFGSLQEADEMRHDPKLQTLDLFWHIHGIGPHLAKNLYDKGYRTIDGLRYRVWPQLVELVEDDPVEKTRLESLEDPGLDREQQQGLKFYDDFLERIPRDEVEGISAVIHRHLIAITDDKAQVMLVGSYRKGKPTSGDVDIVVSHPEEVKTANLVEKLYESLNEEGWIRAKLKISLAHTHRDQKPVFKDNKKGYGFAALDIALLVWQDINWPTKEQDLEEDPDARNPATCRRVDIIVSPWKSVGCAVLGWSGGITFERDIREYAHKVLNWKFDSSGVHDRGTGKQLDIEKYNNPATRAKTIEEAERRVIEGLHLQCFDPTTRLTD